MLKVRSPFGVRITSVRVRKIFKQKCPRASQYRLIAGHAAVHPRTHTPEGRVIETCFIVRPLSVDNLQCAKPMYSREMCDSPLSLLLLLL